MIEDVAFDASSLPIDMPDEVRETIINEMQDETFYSARFEHRTRQLQRVLFDFDEESDGTKRLFSMAGALVTAIRHNFTLVIDEIEESLHPYIVRLLVQMFQNPEIENSTAQLIFTTHSDGLLDSGLLERDQFWFVEKRRGATELIPLNDYRPRKGEAVRLNYLRGRYGGVPAIPSVTRS
jgi:AAA15 family ATPase/GTPase